MEAAALFGGPREHSLLFEALTDAALACAAIRAVGWSGNVAAVDLLIDLIGTNDKRSSRLAAEAFSSITGFDLWDDRYHLPAQPRQEEAHTLPVLEDEDPGRPQGHS